MRLLRYDLMSFNNCLTLENKSVDFDSQACVNAFGLRFYFYLHMRIYLSNRLHEDIERLPGVAPTSTEISAGLGMLTVFSTFM
jgi:hypothetical protein